MYRQPLFKHFHARSSDQVKEVRVVQAKKDRPTRRSPAFRGYPVHGNRMQIPQFRGSSIWVPAKPQDFRAWFPSYGLGLGWSCYVVELLALLLSVDLLGRCFSVGDVGALRVRKLLLADIYVS